MTDMDGLLSTEDICEFMGKISRPTFYKWVARGLPVVKEGPKEFSASKKAISEFFYHRSLAVQEKGKGYGR